MTPKTTDIFISLGLSTRKKELAIQKTTENHVLKAFAKPGLVLPGDEGGLVLPGDKGGLVLPGDEGGLVLQGDEGGLVLPGDEGGLVLPGTKEDPSYQGTKEVMTPKTSMIRDEAQIAVFRPYRSDTSPAQKDPRANPANVNKTRKC
jgi:hypothetical protein